MLGARDPGLPAQLQELGENLRGLGSGGRFRSVTGPGAYGNHHMRAGRHLAQGFCERRATDRGSAAAESWARGVLQPAKDGLKLVLGQRITWPKTAVVGGQQSVKSDELGRFPLPAAAGHILKRRLQERVMVVEKDALYEDRIKVARLHKVPDRQRRDGPGCLAQ